MLTSVRSLKKSENIWKLMRGIYVRLDNTRGSKAYRKKDPNPKKRQMNIHLWIKNPESGYCHVMSETKNTQKRLNLTKCVNLHLLKKPFQDLLPASLCSGSSKTERTRERIIIRDRKKKLEIEYTTPSDRIVVRINDIHIKAIVGTQPMKKKNNVRPISKLIKSRSPH